jgi:hypothetical protein
VLGKQVEQVLGKQVEQVLDILVEQGLDRLVEQGLGKLVGQGLSTLVELAVGKLVRGRQQEPLVIGRLVVAPRTFILHNIPKDSEQLVSQLDNIQLCLRISQQEHTLCICLGTLGERTQFSIQLRSNQCINALLGFGLFI